MVSAVHISQRKMLERYHLILVLKFIWLVCYEWCLVTYIETLNNVTVNKYRSTYIDGGIKNMLKLGLFICHQCLNLIQK
jgi:hypothetical protein